MGRFPLATFLRSLRAPSAGWSAAVLVLALCAAPGPAQEVNWRSDYNAARKEAQEKGLPLIIDFCTENCMWCARLESTTFKDPVILGLMNERFIPLKVFAEQNPQLVEALRVANFPTLVLAAPDGKIISTYEGYRDADKFHGSLQHALNIVNNPEWMTRDFQEASRAVGSGDYAKAVALLKSIGEDRQERPVQVKARQLLHDLEHQATDRLARIKQLQDKGQNAEVMDQLTELLRAFPGTQAAEEGARMLSTLALKPEIKTEQRTRRARELLGQAREDYRTQQFLCCMDRCEILASTFGDLPEGTEAMQLMAEIKNNPEWMRQACDTLSERLGTLYISLAETWLKKGQPHQAELCLERVIQAFPGTPQAEVAMTRLSQIQGQPTRQADFKNQTTFKKP